MRIPNLDYFRTANPTDPQFPRRLAEALRAIQSGSTTTEAQGNLNPKGQPAPPPNIQSVTATGANGVLHVAIQDQSTGLARGVNYYVEHSATPDFRDAQVRNIGDARSHSEFIGNATRYVRAYSAYPGSPPSAHTYHGGQTAPTPVTGGGAIGPPAYLPSQGSGTGAPGQFGVGPGPLPKRTVESGVQWKGRAAGGPSGLLSTGLAVSASGAGLSPSGSGGGGGGVVSAPVILTDTHANRLANFPSVKYPPLTEFWESDRTAWYWVQNAVGTVTVTGGTTVTWVSGNKFINTGFGFLTTQWPAGTTITINGTVCQVAIVGSPTTLVLQAPTTNAVGVPYSVASGRWVFLGGMYTDVYANKPADLGENDIDATFNGFRFFDVDHWRGFEWATTGAAPSSTSPGWGRMPGELPTAMVSILPFGGGQLAGGWQLCDGSAGVSITQDDASLTVIAAPNLVGAYPKGGAYSPTRNPAVNTTLNALVPAGTVGSTFTGAPSGSVNVLITGGVTPVVPAPYTPAGSVSSGFSGTPVTPTVNTQGEPANVLVPFYLKK